jgi:hypothetical protein
LRRYRSPEESRKNTRKRMSSSCPNASATPRDPHIKYCLTLNAGVSTWTRVTPDSGAGAAAVAAFSSSVAAV